MATYMRVKNIMLNRFSGNTCTALIGMIRGTFCTCMRGSYTPQLHRIAKYTKFLELTHLIGSLETLEVARVSDVKSPEETA
jgi:hypothetical protein